MTSKVFKSMMFLGSVILLTVVSVLIYVLNINYQTQMYEDMRGQAELAMQGVRFGGIEYLESLSSQNRITWIDVDGTVLYDSYHASDYDENYSVREEVAEAMLYGEGMSDRQSDSMNTRYLYYAVRAEDNTVIRIAVEQKLLRNLVFDMSRHLIWIAVLMIYGSLLIAYQLTRKVMEPLNCLPNYDSATKDSYPELKPLMNRLEEQNRTISEQMRELLRKEREFTAITENMREGFVMFDNHGIIRSFNSSAERLLELSGSASMRSKTDIMPQRLRRAVETGLIGQHWEGYESFGDRVYQCVVNPVIGSGQVVGALLFMMDATEKQQREQLRREFSANVSHELKTPLTSISGFAELMMNGMIPAGKMQECAGDIYKQSQQLINLVGDIIKLSNLDEGRSFDIVEVDLYESLKRVAERLQPAADRANVQLQIVGVPCKIQGVTQIVDEMLYNLCDNAIKYNVPGGYVTASVRPGEETATFTVTDTGIGIPYGEQERIFERFYRVDKSHSKEIGGTGLGLSIVKHGAQFHGAEITVDSYPGKGTSINIVFRNRMD